MISTTGSDNSISFNGVPNGVFYTATINCIVFFHSNTTTPNFSNVRVGSGSYGGHFIVYAGTQSGCKLNIGDTLIATGISYPFKLIVIKYD